MLLCRYIGLDYGSPTLDSAMINLVPAFAFILAVTFRMEKLNWGSTSSQVKIIGTLISIAGAFIVAFYTGPMIFRTQSLTAPIHLLVFSPRLKWITGSFFLATAAFMTALWYTLQVRLVTLTRFIALMLSKLNFSSFSGNGSQNVPVNTYCMFLH